jgi:hypothetical protein
MIVLPVVHVSAGRSIRRPFLANSPLEQLAAGRSISTIDCRENERKGLATVRQTVPPCWSIIDRSEHIFFSTSFVSVRGRIDSIGRSYSLKSAASLNKHRISGQRSKKDYESMTACPFVTPRSPSQLAGSEREITLLPF